MKWRYVKKLKDNSLIADFEQEINYRFCDEFCEIVTMYNGGRPSCQIFDTDEEKERGLKSFLSFNHDDYETVWKAVEWIGSLSKKYVPFAMDNFGNLICFEKKTGMIVFLDHENSRIERIAKNFHSFLRCLY